MLLCPSCGRKPQRSKGFCEECIAIRESVKQYEDKKRSSER